MDIKFIDGDGSVIELEAERKRDYISISGNIVGGSGGQIVDDIEPKNEPQSALIDFWKEVHLNSEENTDENWEKLQSIKEDIENLEIAEFEDDVNDDPKIMALASFLGVKPSSVEHENDNRYSVGKGTFLVCTDDEADDEARESVISLIDDIGISGFNVSAENYVDESWFEQALREMAESYIEGIEDENSRLYPNRLIEEMYDADILDDDDFETDEDGNVDLSIVKDEVDLDSKKEEFIERYISDAGDPVEYYISNFGKDGFNDVVKEYGLVDEDKLVDYVISTDGRGHILNSYDGSEDEVTIDGETYYIYRN